MDWETRSRRLVSPILISRIEVGLNSGLLLGEELCPNQTKGQCQKASSCHLRHYEELTEPTLEDGLRKLCLTSGHEAHGQFKLDTNGLSIGRYALDSKNTHPPLSANWIEMIDQIKRKRSKRHPCQINRGNVFNPQLWDHLFGRYDIVVIDPPWSIKQILPYPTMTISDVESLPINKLGNNFYIFCWATTATSDSIPSIFNKWGILMVDKIIWTKTNNLGIVSNIKNNGRIFSRCYEICFVGRKGNPIEPVVNNLRNVIFSHRKRNGEKPQEFYDMIEMMFPYRRKIEIFARDTQIRYGWTLMGLEASLPPNDI